MMKEKETLGKKKKEGKEGGRNRKRKGSNMGGKMDIKK